MTNLITSLLRASDLPSFHFPLKLPSFTSRTQRHGSRRYFPSGKWELRGGVTSTANPQIIENPALLHSNPVRLRPELLVKPDPITLYLGFWGTSIWKLSVAGELAHDVENWWVKTGRIPTQDEFDVFTAAGSRALYNKDLGFPIGYFLGSSYLFWGARKSPYYPKKPSLANFFTGLNGFRLKEPAAFRTMLGQKCFMMLFILTASGIVTRYSAAFRYAEDLQDPRMSGYMSATENSTPEAIQMRQRALAHDRHRRMKAHDYGFAGRILEDLGYTRHTMTGQGEQGQSKYDSASSATVSSENETAYGTSQNGQDASAPQSSYGSVQNSGNGSSQSDSKLDFFGSSDEDAASPTAPEYRNTSMTGMSTGSAWDRIRQQNSAAQGSRSAAPRQWGQAQAQSDTGPTNDSFPIDQDRYGYNRRREKDQAQADFDKLMDAERNASSEGPSRGRNW
ncbi:Endo-1-3(4)-beta-glucanase [Penicillium waksmanii]|uniref:Endo-1-3(4)-beta-glucanase n=1 Tax=Penicillium waksmanii TaxID=69791 RepID=UPI002549230E|nr:Endo-1-3(4)-beta-glucanase [Penicillium waksmanii]KAJ5980676.1 Endo-1-3(4)-beta-glucanase [Penicillium waksmanii]